jgi:hypothetical protein
MPGIDADQSGDEEPLKPLHFRIEAVADQVHTAAGRIEASGEGGRKYDRAVLDLDGDGNFEKRIALEESPYPPTEGRFSVELDLELGGLNWRLDLHGPLAKPFEGTVHMDWTQRRNELFLFFINGKATLYATAEEAAKGQAIRLGPPFRFDVRTSKRGPDALVNVGLKDSNGCTMRIATRSGENPTMGDESRIQLTLLADGEARSTLEAEYG